MMKCPRCRHDMGEQIVKCLECGETYEQEALGEFQKLTYLLDWLDTHKKSIGLDVHSRLRSEVEDQLGECGRSIGLTSQAPPQEPMRPPEALRLQLTLIEQTLQLLADRLIELSIVETICDETVRQALKK